MSCEHRDVHVSCDFNRLTDIDGGPVTAFLLDVRVECQQCGEPFCFRGLPLGLSHLAPTGSLDAAVATLPIHPMSDPTTGIGSPGFSVQVHGFGEPDDDPVFPGVDTSDPDDHGIIW